MVTTETEAQLLGLLQKLGPLSRQQLHQRTGLRPNTVGDIAGRLIQRGLLTEGEPQAVGPGRPRVPLQIDESRCWVIGLALEPGSVQGCRLNLQGRRIGRTLTEPVGEKQLVTEVAAGLVERLTGEEAVAVGVTTTGLLDAESRRILYSSAVPDHHPATTQPIYDAAGELPIRFDNDMRALAIRWQLTHPASPSEDLMLVVLRDHAIGASLMIDGKPNRGCVVGGNELGFSHLPLGDRLVKLEDILSTSFLHELDPDTPGDLASRIARSDPQDSALNQVTRLLALGLSNVSNFVRPHRLVLASELTRHTRFYHALLGAMRETLMGPVAERMRIDTWDEPLPQGAEAAGWLALDMVYRPNSQAIAL